MYLNKIMYNFLFKLIMVGDTCVGKSCLLMQFVHQEFAHVTESTIGVDFGTKTIKINEDDIKLQIWDTAGQETYKSIIRAYYRGSAGALLIFDVTDKNSFEHIKTWLNEIRSYANDNVKIILIGNKTDLLRRTVSYDIAKSFADLNNLIYIETSAKTGHNVDSIFETLGLLIYEEKDRLKNNINTGIIVGTHSTMNIGRKKCCKR